jgi:hypothetical protein
MTPIGPDSVPLPIVRAHFLDRSSFWTCFRSCHLYGFLFPVSFVLTSGGKAREHHGRHDSGKEEDSNDCPSPWRRTEGCEEFAVHERWRAFFIGHRISRLRAYGSVGKLKLWDLLGFERECSILWHTTVALSFRLLSVTAMHGIGQ